MPPQRTSIRGYQDLEVWQRAMDLVIEAYRATQSFPMNERYGLTAQIRRAAVSVPSNIAEGRGRATAADFLRHLAIANGSIMEVETQLLIAARLGYLSTDASRVLLRRCSEVGRLLAGLVRAMKRRLTTPAPGTRHPTVRNSHRDA
jgi:four helix bundle protein